MSKPKNNSPQMQPMPASQSPKRTTQTLATLAGIAEEIPADKTRQVEVDITRFRPSGESAVLVWERPDIRRMYMVGNDAEDLMGLHPNWKRQMAIDVATVAACHVAPATGGLPVGSFYALMCERNSELWLYIMQQLGDHFPHLRGARDEKYFETLVKLSCLCLKRFPTELEGPEWDAEIINRLKIMSDNLDLQTNLS